MEGGGDVAPETADRPHDECDVHGVEDERPTGKHPLDRVAPVEQEYGDACDRSEHAHRVRKPERLDHDRARRGPDHGEHEERHQDVGDLEQYPPAPQQSLEEAAVLEGPEAARELERGRGNQAPDQGRDAQHGHQPRDRPERQEKLDDLPSSPVAARDDR